MTYGPRTTQIRHNATTLKAALEALEAQIAALPAGGEEVDLSAIEAQLATLRTDVNVLTDDMLAFNTFKGDTQAVVNDMIPLVHRDIVSHEFVHDTNDTSAVRTLINYVGNGYLTGYRNGIRISSSDLLVAHDQVAQTITVTVNGIENGDHIAFEYPSGTNGNVPPVDESNWAS